MFTFVIFVILEVQSPDKNGPDSQETESTPFSSSVITRSILWPSICAGKSTCCCNIPGKLQNRTLVRDERNKGNTSYNLNIMKWRAIFVVQYTTLQWHLSIYKCYKFMSQIIFELWPRNAVSGKITKGNNLKNKVESDRVFIVNSPLMRSIHLKLST